MSKRLWPNKGEIVEVEWVDAASTNGWQRGDDIDREQAVDGGLVECRSTGYLLSKDKRAVRLAQSQTTHGSVSEIQAIPRSCVRSIKKLSRST